MPQESNEHKLLIQFICKNKSKIFKKLKYIVQGRPLIFGLKIKNIDNQPSPEASIQSFKIMSAEGGTIQKSFDEKFDIPKLNPGQEITIWWPDPISVVIKGQTWMECFVTPKEPTSKIRTYQFDENCNTKNPYQSINRWGNAIFIRGEMEHQQAITNLLMFLLTLLVFLDGIWGLEEIFKFISKNLGEQYLKIGEFLQKIGS